MCIRARCVLDVSTGDRKKISYLGSNFRRVDVDRPHTITLRNLSLYARHDFISGRVIFRVDFDDLCAYIFV